MKEFLTVRELSEFLSIKPSTIYTLVQENRIPHYRIGKLVRFRTSEIMNWVQKGKRGAKEIGPVRKNIPARDLHEPSHAQDLRAIIERAKSEVKEGN